MKYQELLKIKKIYFGYEDISRVLGITCGSAQVFANRYVKNGSLVRIKRNIYVLSERWRSLGREDIFMLSNLLQVPSYISLMTALDHYEITTQVQQGYVESIVLKRTKRIEVEKNIFNYTRIEKSLYFGFTKKGNFFIASPEKAFLDAIYLMSLGRYDLDMDSIDFNKLDKDKIKKILKKFPVRTKKFLEGYGYFKKT